MTQAQLHQRILRWLVLNAAERGALAQLVEGHQHDPVRQLAGRLSDLEAHSRYQDAQLAELYDRVKQVTPPTPQDRARDAMRDEFAGLVGLPPVPNKGATSLPDVRGGE